MMKKSIIWRSGEECYTQREQETQRLRVDFGVLGRQKEIHCGQRVMDKVGSDTGEVNGLSLAHAGPTL